MTAWRRVNVCQRSASNWVFRSVVPAELSGLTHYVIGTIEQDKVSPAISTLQKLLKVYGLSLEFFAEPEKPDEPQVVINQDDLIDIESGVSMKLVHNGNPNRTLAMMFETYQQARQPGRELNIRVKRLAQYWKVK